MLRALVKLVMMIGLSHCKPASAERTDIVFAISAPSSAPYLYYDPEKLAYQGVVVDFFASFSAEDGYLVAYLDSSRARNEHYVASGKADMFLSSPRWLENPQKLIFSEAMLSHKTFLYATSLIDPAFEISSLPGKLFCTRISYVYPTLEGFFQINKYTRVDSSSQNTMTKMLLKGRCDYAVMNEFSAMAVLHSAAFCDAKFYQSPAAIDDVPLRLAIRPSLAEQLPNINRQLHNFRKSGALKKSIESHSGLKSFPKLPDCD